jgi:hypothetical protein
MLPALTDIALIAKSPNEKVGDLTLAISFCLSGTALQMLRVLV